MTVIFLIKWLLPGWDTINFECHDGFFVLVRALSKGVSKDGNSKHWGTYPSVFFIALGYMSVRARLLEPMKRTMLSHMA